MERIVFILLRHLARWVSLSVMAAVVTTPVPVVQGVTAPCGVAMPRRGWRPLGDRHRVRKRCGGG